MNMEMINNLMTKGDIKQHALKVQPVKKFIIHIKGGKVIAEKDAWNMWRLKINTKIGGDDVELVEDAEMRPSTLSVNGK